MKKLLFISIFLFSCIMSFGQTLFSENFSNGLGDWKIDSHQSNWEVSSSSDAGGSAPELKFKDITPPFNGESRAISPNIDTQGNSKVTLTFNYRIWDPQGKTDYKVGVAVRSATFGSSWKEVWSQIGGQTVTEQKTVQIDVPSGNSSFQICFYFEGNSYSIYNFCVDNVKVTGSNGGDDGNDGNDGITVSRKKLPLFEIFSSSTCGPCTYFNNNTLTPFMHSHPEVPVVKYQMNWPVPGDKYCTQEGKAMKYPAVQGIPAKFSDGSSMQSPSSALSQASGNADFAIGAIYEVDGNTIKVKVKVEPYTSGTYNLYIAIVEGTTTGNAISSREPEFHNVMMKMVPDTQGTSISFNSGTPVSKFFKQSMSGTNVEEMSDLKAVVFVQKGRGKVYQAVYAKEGDTSLGVDDQLQDVTDCIVYPNPTTGIVNLQNRVQCHVAVSNTLGQRVLEFNKVMPNAQLDLTELSDGVYYIAITNNDVTTSKKIVINKDKQLKK